ncbi:hypothetical protein RB623_02445 [Mesorhizobium sp. LHD-90]|uniref:hypothetical protein n=1 Tax=Mesorhizobium sp. LHD-90 TaxID=3071414 RepID=UPI0027DEBB74|nr:hypothetical protein [Mesorhizobium sp. LHD-90]MDQ6432912.1 hypothetical protein [Mesorhizobium sp. LHD-90]
MIGLLAAAFAAAGSSANAQEQAERPALALELNAAQPSQKGCRLTFVVTNGLGAELSKAAFEIALFNEVGVVDTLTVLDFKDLPSGKTKVTRFDLPLDCAKITRVLVNRAVDCAGDGVEPSACIRQLAPGTKAKIAFGL